MSGGFVRLRCLIVAAVAVGGAAPLVGGCWWVASGTPSDTVEGAVVRLCALAGVVAVLMLLLQALIGVADAWQGRTPGQASTVRRWVRATCGVGLGVALALPASGAWAAEPPGIPQDAPVRSSLSGLPLPEQPSDGRDATSRASKTPSPQAPLSSDPQPGSSAPPSPVPPPPAPSARADQGRSQRTEPDGRTSARDTTHIVLPGDTLWDLARVDLESSSSRPPGNAEIASRWQTWYAQNRAVIGADPDLLLPGTTLTRPSLPATTENRGESS